MKYFSIYLIARSIVSFLAAAFLNLPHGHVYGIVPEGFSRASTNLSLIAIAIGIWWRELKNINHYAIRTIRQGAPWLDCSDYSLRRNRGKTISRQILISPKNMAKYKTTAAKKTWIIVEHMVFIKAIILTLLSAENEEEFNIARLHA
jgi:hypothetical protein